MPSYRNRWAANIAATCLALMLFGCEGERPSDPAPALAPADVTSEDPPTPERAWRLDLASLREAVERAGERVSPPDGPISPSEAIRAARLARILSIRDADERPIERARGWLALASEDRELEGACDAALALARLLAREAEAAAAYRQAFRVSLRFAATAPECAESARRMLPPLSPWRPGEDELASIRADPDAALRTSRGGAPSDDPVARWLAGHGGAGAGALEAMDVHGVDEDGAVSIRVVLRFSEVVAYEHGEAAASPDAPRRTWLHLPAVSAARNIVRDVRVGAGGLRRISVREQGGGARVAFELEDNARFHTFVLLDPFRVVIDFDAGGARAEGPVEVIVLDPGHGGNDFGARAFGMRESDLTLDIVRRVRAMLRRQLPSVRVVSTREEDVRVSLEARAALANAVNADLFLSVHLNAADEPIERGGVTTFVLDTSDDRQALRLAARENRTSVAQVSSLARLIASMHREGQVATSRAFAEQLQRSTLAAGRQHLPGLYDRGVRSAMFYVLVGARMPAVLLEASFLSREDEAAALRTPEYRQSLADGIARGIVRWAGL